mmetsp:Transcript_2529/g.7699  ORF Transcript_2529/g.7699 Transcript_2529/m.7699 type:complete len:201 (-) Transcript_2529:319-921(-)
MWSRAGTVPRRSCLRAANTPRQSMSGPWAASSRSCSDASHSFPARTISTSSSSSPTSSGRQRRRICTLSGAKKPSVLCETSRCGAGAGWPHCTHPLPARLWTSSSRCCNSTRTIASRSTRPCAILTWPPCTSLTMSRCATACSCSTTASPTTSCVSATFRTRSCWRSSASIPRTTIASHTKLVYRPLARGTFPTTTSTVL